MAYKITYDCIACSACVEDCSNQAISEGPGIYQIDPERCTECEGVHDSPQCASICPVDACVPDPEHPGIRRGFLPRSNQALPLES